MANYTLSLRSTLLSVFTACTTYAVSSVLFYVYSANVCIISAYIRDNSRIYAAEYDWYANDNLPRDAHQHFIYDITEILIY